MRANWFIAGAIACAAAPAHAQQTVYMPIVIEVSGNGAVSGTNFRDGALMAIDEINAKGGILKRKINAPVSDTQSNAAISRAQVQKAIDGDPYVILGPVFSGSVKVNMILCQQAEVPQITGAEAADITQAGNPYIFRTSFGQQMSMPKIANYIRDGLKAKTVAVLWVNNDFGTGASALSPTWPLAPFADGPAMSITFWPRSVVSPMSGLLTPCFLASRRKRALSSSLV
jgi:branched-chain amino acid transport system substrate-binding protein